MKFTKFTILHLKPIRYLLNKLKQVILPGLNGASLYDVAKFFVKETSNVDLLERADLVTYSFFMAIPSALLFLFSLIPYLPLTNVEQTIMKTLKLITPNVKTYQTIQTVIGDFMHKQYHNILSFGALLTLYYASNGMLSLMKSFDRSVTLYKKRNFFQLRWTAIKLTIMVLGVLIATLAVLLIQNRQLNGPLMRLFGNPFAVKFVSYLILTLLIFVTNSLVYTYAPSMTQRFRFVSAGSVFSTVAILIVTAVFFYLVNNFLYYNKVYGSIGTLIAFLVWLWYNTVIILIGFQLNVSIRLGKLAHEKNTKKETIKTGETK